MTGSFNLIAFIATAVWPVAIAVAQGQDCNGNGVPDHIDLAGKIYWADADTQKIQRADLDGTDKRTKLDGLINDRNFKQTNCQGGLLGGVLGGGGKLGEMLGTALGRQPASAQPQPGQQPATPQDQLKDLLGGLGDLLKKR